MELAVPKMDQKSQISLVLGSNIIKIIKNDRVHGFWAQEGENIPSNPHGATIGLLKVYTSLLRPPKPNQFSVTCLPSTSSYRNTITVTKSSGHRVVSSVPRIESRTHRVITRVPRRRPIFSILPSITHHHPRSSRKNLRDGKTTADSEITTITKTPRHRRVSQRRKWTSSARSGIGFGTRRGNRFDWKTGWPEIPVETRTRPASNSTRKRINGRRSPATPNSDSCAKSTTTLEKGRREKPDAGLSARGDVGGRIHSLRSLPHSHSPISNEWNLTNLEGTPTQSAIYIMWSLWPLSPYPIPILAPLPPHQLPPRKISSILPDSHPSTKLKSC